MALFVLVLFIIIPIFVLRLIRNSRREEKSKLEVKEEVLLEGPEKSFEVHCEEYVRRKFLFDSISEFHFFKTLQELVGDKYYVFPQVGYVHLIDETSHDFYQRRKYRAMIDRKSADYVLCDKERIAPQLVIELNGNSHSLPDRIKRDDFIREVAKCVNLPILTIDVRDIQNKDQIIEKIQFLLKK